MAVAVARARGMGVALAMAVALTFFVFVRVRAKNLKYTQSIGGLFISQGHFYVFRSVLLSPYSGLCRAIVQKRENM